MSYMKPAIIYFSLLLLLLRHLSCPTLCDPIDVSPPGSPVPGILQARTLEWVAISFGVFKILRNAPVIEVVQPLLEGVNGEVSCRYFGVSEIQKKLGRIQITSGLGS